MCMPDRSWFIDDESRKIFSLPNVQSHSALRRLLQIDGRDGEIFIPELVGGIGRKRVKELTIEERLFLLDELRNFNQFMLNNLAFVFREEFLEVFYHEKAIREVNGLLFYYRRDDNPILYHWLCGELPVIPSPDDVISILSMSDNDFLRLSSPNFLPRYRGFNSFLRNSIESFKREISPNLRERRVKELLKNLEVRDDKYYKTRRIV